MDICSIIFYIWTRTITHIIKPEDIVQSYLKDYEYLNYLLPVQIGAPDMAKNYSNLPSVNNGKWKYLYTSDVSSLDLLNIDLIKLQELAPYLCGLLEGDGHIWVPSTLQSPSGKKYTPRFHITFVMKDLPLAKYISNLLGGVQIRMKTKENACVLTVNSLPKVILLASLPRTRVMVYSVALKSYNSN